MIYSHLISSDQLSTLHARDVPLMVFDCSFDLMNPSAGAALYAQSQIPGAIYTHLDDDLSDKSEATDTASGGRHPLPSRDKFAAWLSNKGFHNDMQAVVYDRNNANFCVRLWWMLKWCGHDAVAVLDGGMQAWIASGFSVETVRPSPLAPCDFMLQRPKLKLITIETVAKQLGSTHQTLIDARATPRYKGELEPLDPVAGHIPGALNRPFSQNMDAHGKIKPATVLKKEFEALLAGRPPHSVVHYCGSGVSALPNLLAMEVAGLSGSSLFAGSWSQWSSRSDLPVAQG